MDQRNQGHLSAIIAFFLWGIAPLYWKELLGDISAVEILIHRVLWSCPFLFLVLFLTRDKQTVSNLLKSIFKNKIYILSSLLLIFNWLLFIWAVNNNFIVETSLGYFLSPMFNVLLGVVFFGEILKFTQKIAIFCVIIGVFILVFSYGSFPWIALFLALSFSLYGLIKKMGNLNPLESLTFEMMIAYIPILIIFIIFGFFVDPTPQIMMMPIKKLLLLSTTGITSLPLLFFAYAARRITLSSLGVVQYLTPTLQLLIAIFIYKEVFTIDTFIGFLFIWLGVLIFNFNFFKKAGQASL